MKRAAACVLLAFSLLAGCGSGSGTSAPDDTRAVLEEDEFADPGEGDNSDQLAATKCSEGQPVEGRALRVVATIAPLTSLVGLMAAGTDIEVRGLVPAGATIHSYLPTESDIEAIQDADLLITQGIGLEDAIVELSAPALSATAGLCEVGTASFSKTSQLHSDSYPSANGLSNPHSWLSPTVVMRYLNAIRNALSVRAPGAIEVIDENYVRISAQMQAIDTAMKKDTETVPVRSRSIFAHHDAFVYVAREYGYSYPGAAQKPDMSDPDPLEVVSLAESLGASNVVAVFPGREWETTVIDEIGTVMGVPHTAALSDEELPGKPGEVGHSIGGMIVGNFVTIVETLGGTAKALRAVSLDLGIRDVATYTG
ncbi:MAG: metal ABC transporter substrate-binding protein [Ilumatobacteraceae bacterium]